ncbi:glycosyltransferase family 2 protein [Mesorhizobium sp. AR10]|uniref:glycosyltransferase n=1 Tax=Mesorhizobium sp. AR10 TaxID=2865839 RepID=UPI00215DE7F5|nr:glycosyltransferase family A protein [Mesorhizobium sp. AR10]UVK40215.1 glycosyltransferase family 2 protein [Mesorhizobium sp. AR10]
MNAIADSDRLQSCRPSPENHPSQPVFAVVVIGRNEGQRLVDCLKSLGPHAWNTVYVDSGSRDGSPAMAACLNAHVVRLDMQEPFTAGRARNAGWRAALKCWPGLQFIQFIDGDCLLDSAWINRANRFLESRNDVAGVFGRRRERRIERSVYNALCDREWDGAPGPVLECGGDVFMRVSALRDAGGYASSLIAGEEPELCVRLRARGWIIWRLEAEMTLHDADMTRIHQWWRRNMRAGYAFAEVSTLHWASPFGIWRRNLWRSLGWGGVLPLAMLAGFTLHPAALGILVLYPIQVIRIAAREGGVSRESWRNAFFDVLGKFAEFKGAATFFSNRALGRHQRIIEYK